MMRKITWLLLLTLLSATSFAQLVGINTNTPAYPLDVNGRMRIRHTTNNTAGLWLNRNNNTEASFIGQVNDTTFGVWDAPASAWRFALNHSNGWMGIGTTTPRFPLTFANAVGDKISLWGGNASSTANHYGLGIQSSLLQLYTPTTGDDIAFGTGRSGSFSENMRIKGNGRVGIGTATPTASLTVNGNVRITDGTQGTGKVLTSDASGNAAWRSASLANNDRFWIQVFASRPNSNSDISMSYTLYYNTSSTIAINTTTGTLTFSKAGLYHFEGQFSATVQQNMFNPPPDYTQGSADASTSSLSAEVSIKTGNVTTVNDISVVRGGPFYKYKSTTMFGSSVYQANEGRGGFDLYLPAGAVMVIKSFIPWGASASGTFSGYLIAE